jgi:hypothetical protein
LDTREVAREAVERNSQWNAGWLFERIPPLRGTGRGISCLDVGCWDGSLLDALPAGWRRVGLEPNESAAAVAESRGHEVLVGLVEDVALPAHAFELITMLDVIEHLLDPISVLRRLRESAAPDCLLAILTGDVGSPGARFWRRHWYYLAYPEHVSFFTSAGLRHALVSSGWTPISVERVSHPVTSRRRDVAEGARHLRRRSNAMRTAKTSLAPALGPNRTTVSRMLRGRDHLLVAARLDGR